METYNSYSFYFCKTAAEYQIKEDDSFISCTLKFPINRALNGLGIISAITETIMFAGLSLASMCVLSSENVEEIKAHMIDSANTVVLATKGFFGFGSSIEKKEGAPKKQDPNLQQRAVHHLKLAATPFLKYPNTTFVMAVSLIVLSTFAGIRRYF